MPCGPKDKRRIGHRCLRCRREHLKCDGVRPCAACKNSKSSCESLEKTRVASWIVQKKAQLNSKLPSRPSVLQFEVHRHAFFHAIGLSPIILKAFSVEELKPLAHASPIVQETITLLGGVYICHNPHLLKVSSSVQNSLLGQWGRLRTYLQSQMDTCKPSDHFDVILACGLLMSFVELLVNPSEMTWGSWIHQLYLFSITGFDTSETVKPFTKSLQRTASILNSLRAVCCERNPDIDVSSRLPFLGFREHQLSISPSRLPELANEQLLEILSADFELWSQIQWWGIQWRALNSRVVAEDISESPPGIIKVLLPHDLWGIEVACIASKFQRDILATLLWYSERNLAGGAILAIYKCIAIEISEYFCQPIWLSLGCELPVMPRKLSYDQAMAALQHAEASIEHLNLEAIFFAPILYAMGVQMVRKSDRIRMQDFVAKLKGKGFSVSDQFISNIQRVWSSSPQI